MRVRRGRGLSPAQPEPGPATVFAAREEPRSPIDDNFGKRDLVFGRIVDLGRTASVGRSRDGSKLSPDSIKRPSSLMLTLDLIPRPASMGPLLQ